MLMSERFPRLWRWGQGMFAIFPLLPTWGSIGLLVIAGVAIQKQPRSLLKRPLTWGLLVLSLWLILTSFTAEYPQPAWLGIANFIPFFIVFLGFNLLIETPRQLRRFAWLGIACALPVAILGIGQITLSWTTPKALQPLFGWILVAEGNPTGRLASVFMYANIAGAYFLVMFTLALGLWVEAYRWRKSKLVEWLSLTGIVLLLASALILTSSRNAWLMAMLVTTIFIIYLRWYWLLAMGGAIASAILAAAFAPSPLNLWLQQIVPRYFWARLNDQMYSDRAVETLRTTQWEFTQDLIQQRPFLGWGLRNFTPLYQDAMGIWLGHPHNLPLMLSAEIGIPGMLLLVGLVGSAIAQATILLIFWSDFAPTPGTQQWQQDQLIFLTFLLAFISLTFFNLLDVTLFDLRVNLLAWLLLGGISGVSHYYRHLLMGKKLMS